MELTWKMFFIVVLFLSVKYATAASLCYIQPYDWSGSKSQ